MNGMFSEIKKLKPLSKAYFIAMLLLVCSIVFNNAMNSACIILLLVVWLAEQGFQQKWKHLVKEPFFILNALLLLVYILGIGLSEDKQNAIFFFTKNLSLVIIPMVLLSGKQLEQPHFYLLLKAFILCVFIQMSVESILSVFRFAATHDTGYFFYHKLVSNINMGGAIVASFFCMMSMAFLFYLPDKNKIKWLLCCIFTVWIILLDSKMFLATLLLLIFMNGIRRLSLPQKITSFMVIAASLLLLAFTNNPIKKRFMDMDHFQKSYLTATSFSPDMYFDGLSLRLVYIRFGLEIMHENGNYFTGAGTGDAENLLKKKIVAYHMYTGDGIKEKEGYLKYGYHNEYLQKLVQLGFS